MLSHSLSHSLSLPELSILGKCACAHKDHCTTIRLVLQEMSKSMKVKHTHTYAATTCSRYVLVGYTFQSSTRCVCVCVCCVNTHTNTNIHTHAKIERERERGATYRYKCTPGIGLHRPGDHNRGRLAEGRRRRMLAPRSPANKVAQSCLRAKRGREREGDYILIIWTNKCTHLHSIHKRRNATNGPNESMMYA